MDPRGIKQWSTVSTGPISGSNVTPSSNATASFEGSSIIRSDLNASRDNPLIIEPSSSSGQFELECNCRNEVVNHKGEQSFYSVSQVGVSPMNFFQYFFNSLADLIFNHRELIKSSQQITQANYGNSDGNVSSIFAPLSNNKNDSKLQDSIVAASMNNNQENYDLPLEALSGDWQTSLTILYSLTAVTSFILNTVTVIVLLRFKGSELRKYLINLSVSDLLMSLLSIPFTYTEYMLGRWIFASFLCPLVRFVVTLSVFVSVATMTVIGINRHNAVMYPLRKNKGKKAFQKWRLRKLHVIVGIWVLGIAISMPEYLMFRVEPFCHNGQLYFDCRQIWPSNVSNQYAIFLYLCTFVMPLLVISYLYTRIGLRVWRRQVPGNVHADRNVTMQNIRFKVIKMLFVIVILFALSWLPLQTFQVVILYFPSLRDVEYNSLNYNVFIGTYFLSHWLGMAHSCFNPLVYCFMNEKFRSDLRELICRRKNNFRYLANNNNNNNNMNNCNHANQCSSYNCLAANQNRDNFGRTGELRGQPKSYSTSGPPLVSESDNDESKSFIKNGKSLEKIVKVNDQNSESGLEVTIGGCLPKLALDGASGLSADKSPPTKQDGFQLNSETRKISPACAHWGPVQATNLKVSIVEIQRNLAQRPEFNVKEQEV